MWCKRPERLGFFERFTFLQNLFAFFSSFFLQGFELMLLSLADPSERVVSAVHQVFIPAFAAWTTELGTLHTTLIPSLLARIEKLLSVSPACLHAATSLPPLLPPTTTHTASSGPLSSKSSVVVCCQSKEQR